MSDYIDNTFDAMEAIRENTEKMISLADGMVSIAPNLSESLFYIAKDIQQDVKKIQDEVAKNINRRK